MRIAGSNNPLLVKILYNQPVANFDFSHIPNNPYKRLFSFITNRCEMSIFTKKNQDIGRIAQSKSYVGEIVDVFFNLIKGLEFEP